jgi:DNA-binding response OmpR family regulator
MPQTVLIIEDEPDVVRIVEHNLRREGFKVLSETARRVSISPCAGSRTSSCWI